MGKKQAMDMAQFQSHPGGDVHSIIWQTHMCVCAHSPNWELLRNIDMGTIEAIMDKIFQGEYFKDITLRMINIGGSDRRKENEGTQSNVQNIQLKT